MATALVRRKGLLALALSSSLHGRKAISSAFQHRGLLNGASSTPSPSHVPSISAASSSSSSSDDPSLANGDDDYEWLKRSRPMRIHARLARRPSGSGGGGGGGVGNIIGSPAVTKIVHFQRHGQGTHNELYREWTERTGMPPDLSETDPTKNPLLSSDVVDAPLTERGRDQCAERRPVASALDGLELVVSSPLTRALQTAHITFEDHLPYNYNNSAPSSSRGGVVRWMAHEGVREELGTLLCNKRRPSSETEREFPEVDYTHVAYGEGEADAIWDDHAERTSRDNDGVPRRETAVDMSHRAYNFLVNFVHKRPEREIAVVGHSAWLLAMTGAVLDVGEDEDLITPMFGQAELRSMELVFLEQQQ